jgi:hypothetical protein
MPSEEVNNSIDSSKQAANPVPPTGSQTTESFFQSSPTLEDKPVESAPVVSEPIHAEPVTRRESWFKRAIRSLMFALLFLLIGAAALYFTLYRTASAELTQLRLEATTSANQVATLEAQLNTAQTDLSSSRATIQSNNDQIAALTLKLAVYKMKTDVNTIRVALLKLDPITARQALNASRADLADLTALKVDASTLDGFTKRLDNTDRLMATDPQKAMLELDNLIDNLYLLESNLK